jgi:hypothetical protein
MKAFRDARTKRAPGRRLNASSGVFCEGHNGQRAKRCLAMPGKPRRKAIALRIYETMLHPKTIVAFMVIAMVVGMVIYFFK